MTTNHKDHKKTQLTITKAVIEDAGSIINFLNKIGGETDHLTFAQNEFPLSVSEEAQVIKDCLKDDFQLMLVGKINNTIVSQLFLSRSQMPRLSHIADLGLSVSKEFWGKSFGSQMLSIAIDWAKNKNLDRIHLQVRTDNPLAIKLYKKFGFSIEGTIKRAIKIDHIHYDEFVMGLLL